MAYQTINTIFKKNNTDLSASEAHGLATGILCIESQAEAANWLAELLPEEVILIDEDKIILMSLFEQTRKLLNKDDDSFRFDLFLPGDDAPFSEQLIAIRDWCDGFLFGIGYTRSSSEWPGETGEIIKDIVEFTKLETQNEEVSEGDDVALMEIQEYLRVAAMMIRDQFNENEQGYTH